VYLTTHLHLESRLRIHGSVTLFPHMATGTVINEELEEFTSIIILIE